MAREPVHERRVVGVLRDDGAAERVARTLTNGGIQRDSIRIGGGRDDVISLRGEMREEMDETLTGPRTRGAIHQGDAPPARMARAGVRAGRSDRAAALGLPFRSTCPSSCD